MKDMMLGKLPDALLLNNGERVADADGWRLRRQEIIDGALKLCYGGMPPEPEHFELQTLYEGGPGRTGTYKIITGSAQKQLSIYLKIYRPKTDGKTPVVLDGDGCWHYLSSDIIDEVLSHGYSLAVFDRTELVRDLWHDPKPRDSALYEVYPDIGSGTIAGWAWGMQRCVDALTRIEWIDAENIAVTGHSRGGKTAMLAGVTDERIKFITPNGSGAGGAGCWRYITLEPEEWQQADNPTRSERVDDMFFNFPNWLGKDMEPFGKNEGALPFDQHFFKALAAPRWFLQTEGFADVWANSKGTYLTYLAAKEVYRLLGVEERILSHFREGGHAHRLSDFRLLLNVMDHAIKGAPLSDEFDQDPFPEMKQYL